MYVCMRACFSLGFKLYRNRASNAHAQTLVRLPSQSSMRVALISAK